jgi:hypothetical protein
MVLYPDLLRLHLAQLERQQAVYLILKQLSMELKSVLFKIRQFLLGLLVSAKLEAVMTAHLVDRLLMVSA